MTAVFLEIVNRSVNAGWLILAVIVLRLFLKKAPKALTCLLWAAVALRLALPFSVESALSLIPSRTPIPTDIERMAKPAVDTGIAVVNEAINPVIEQSFAPNVGDSANPLQIVIPILVFLWLAGMAVLLLTALFSYINLKRNVGASLSVGENVRVCDEVQSPFILGIIKPIIYLPSAMKTEEETTDYVLRHENAHIRRLDHLWKPLGYLLLTVYWFHPLCWIAYVLFCRDVETACDERVIRELDSEGKAAYSQALLSGSLPKKRIIVCPVAFCEVGVKERVRSVLHYKKPAFWVTVLAALACIVLVLCFLTDPFSEKDLDGKLSASLDAAAAEHNRSAHSADHFAASDCHILRIRKEPGKTAVYAWVLYEEYSCDETGLQVEQGSHIPAVITFDTSKEDDSPVYEVLEYWEPRDGSYYAKDIRAKFPVSLWGKAFDFSCVTGQQERCRRAAEAHFGVFSPSRVKLIEKNQNAEESFFRVGVTLPMTDLSRLGTPLAGKLRQEWEKYDSLSEEAFLASSHLWGIVYLETDTWDECEKALGFSVENPLESMTTLEKTASFSTENTSAKHIQITADASGSTDRTPTHINVSADYAAGNVRVLLTATISAKGGAFTTGSACVGLADYAEKESSSGSGIPVLLVNERMANNTGYYHGNYFSSYAYWVKDGVLYTLRVYGDAKEEAEIKSVLDEILSNV